MSSTPPPARLLRALRGRKVAVVGDAMLDAFLWGDATRISPEAPVPVVLLERQSWALGGAANVAANVAALGGAPVLFAVRGADAAGLRLERLVHAAGIALGALPAVPRRPTTVKYRVFARNKHLLRFDRETTTPISPAEARALLQEVAADRAWEALVISDYAKGCVTPALVRGLAALCRTRRLPWCVDPKLVSLRYPRATVLKPNRTELAALAQLPAETPQQLRRAAACVLRRQRCQYLLVTRGSQGMALFGADGSEHWLDGGGQAVADVTGAGDTVSAVLALGLAAHLPLRTVAALANRAAAFVVSQPGIAVVRPQDLDPSPALLK
ncbi:MAG: bifunctional heptose 7-phosphate kinase/heptose 1-phosphate adenyltransferase [Terriglobales bacterium]